MNIHSSSNYKQFPLRLNLALSNSLERIAKETRIPKTELSRIAITKFLTQLEQSGVRDAMIELCRV